MPNARAGDGSPTLASWDARRGEEGQRAHPTLGRAVRRAQRKGRPEGRARPREGRPKGRARSGDAGQLQQLPSPHGPSPTGKNCASKISAERRAFATK